MDLSDILVVSECPVTTEFCPVAVVIPRKKERIDYL
jgi:hypothetical protein